MSFNDKKSGFKYVNEILSVWADVTGLIRCLWKGQECVVLWLAASGLNQFSAIYECLWAARCRFSFFRLLPFLLSFFPSSHSILLSPPHHPLSFAFIHATDAFSQIDFHAQWGGIECRRGVVIGDESAVALRRECERYKAELLLNKHSNNLTLQQRLKKESRVINAPSTQ